MMPNDSSISTIEDAEAAFAAIMQVIIFLIWARNRIPVCGVKDLLKKKLRDMIVESVEDWARSPILPVSGPLPVSHFIVFLHSRIFIVQVNLSVSNGILLGKHGGYQTPWYRLVLRVPEPDTLVPVGTAGARYPAMCEVFSTLLAL